MNCVQENFDLWVWLRVFSFLPLPSILKFCSTCRRHRLLLLSPHLWPVLELMAIGWRPSSRGFFDPSPPPVPKHNRTSVSSFLPIWKRLTSQILIWLEYSGWFSGASPPNRQYWMNDNRDVNEYSTETIGCKQKLSCRFPSVAGGQYHLLQKADCVFASVRCYSSVTTGDLYWLRTAFREPSAKVYDFTSNANCITLSDRGKNIFFPELVSLDQPTEIIFSQERPRMDAEGSSRHLIYRVDLLSIPKNESPLRMRPLSLDKDLAFIVPCQNLLVLASATLGSQSTRKSPFVRSSIDSLGLVGHALGVCCNCNVEFAVVFRLVPPGRYRLVAFALGQEQRGWNNALLNGAILNSSIVPWRDVLSGDERLLNILEECNPPGLVWSSYECKGCSSCFRPDKDTDPVIPALYYLTGPIILRAENQQGLYIDGQQSLSEIRWTTFETRDTDYHVEPGEAKDVLCSLRVSVNHESFFGVEYFALRRISAPDSENVEVTHLETTDVETAATTNGTTQMADPTKTTTFNMLSSSFWDSLFWQLDSGALNRCSSVCKLLHQKLEQEGTLLRLLLRRSRHLIESHEQFTHIRSLLPHFSRFAMPMECAEIESYAFRNHPHALLGARFCGEAYDGGASELTFYRYLPSGNWRLRLVAEFMQVPLLEPLTVAFTRHPEAFPLVQENTSGFHELIDGTCSLWTLSDSFTLTTPTEVLIRMAFNNGVFESLELQPTASPLIQTPAFVSSASYLVAASRPYNASMPFSGVTLRIIPSDDLDNIKFLETSVQGAFREIMNVREHTTWWFSTPRLSAGIYRPFFRFYVHQELDSRAPVDWEEAVEWTLLNLTVDLICTLRPFAKYGSFSRRDDSLKLLNLFGSEEANLGSGAVESLYCADPNVSSFRLCRLSQMLYREMFAEAGWHIYYLPSLLCVPRWAADQSLACMMVKLIPYGHVSVDCCGLELARDESYS
eukprot:Gregarina_sp_Poly_1__2166@NODE_1575_length_3805_cov_36_529963_g1041_i0_p1_GENE_NODE_1575_length_3805_cov_36_529963_g1041_i0NODE_1575_length_3805_cov_36_529963_g1041_i0_p1_ORF_typecomplete_len957_score111_56Fbox/PF00646_33/0_012Fbox/PF00646_33/48Fboxlike/PF12937_7/0_083Fboxlike/PF12937_7/1_8e02Fboxlike/PF12937_7/1_4e04MRPS27/PF10037_9/0_18_NODE_1575_length_3805_cov_36_529963_g1041_i04033273